MAEKIVKKGHCLGKAHCRYLLRLYFSTVYYTVYIYTLQHYKSMKGQVRQDCPPSELCDEDDSASECSDIVISSDLEDES